jgi:chemotaxis protein MotB
MAENAAQPIVVKKIKKGGHGHHGGAWKVAYADFVTAMMAFFLLLWLLNVSDPVTLGGISSYFQNPSAVNAAGGASTSMIDLGSNVDVRGRETPTSEEEKDFEDLASKEYLESEMNQMQDMQERLEEMLETNPALMGFKDQVMMDISNEGLRIQIMDKDKRPMFNLGSKNMKSYTRKLMKELGPVIKQIPNKISISGHTDSAKFSRRDGYSNWELSADRANAARRALIEAKFPAEKIARVVGLADRAPYDTENRLNPMNRRITIILLNAKAEQAILRDEGSGGAITPVPAILPSELKEAIKQGAAAERFGTIQR